MKAIIQAGGKQFKVEEGLQITIDKLKLNVNDEVTLDKVLLVSKSEGESVTLGMPFVQGAYVKATVIDHVKGDKVINFKYKSKKGYHRKVGHRQNYTVVEIKEIKA